MRRTAHVNLRAPADTIAQLRHSYVEIVGLAEGPRPRFRSGSRGHWLYAGGRDVLHLSVARDDEPVRPATGAFNHIAFACDDLDAARERLDRAGITYATDVMDDLHQTQLFLTNPAGVGIELAFTADPRQPA